MTTDGWIIGERSFSSRLLLGSGKYASMDQMFAALSASATEMVTVAIRRLGNPPQNEGEDLLSALLDHGYAVLPNTAGCTRADEAIRTALLARELLDGQTLIKLEVIGDATTLYPDVCATLKATEQLVAMGFDVMAYTSDDPVAARQMEELGCAAIMPLAAPIGSGWGIRNLANIRFIVEQAKIPVLVDAGVGTASDAAIAMELGCDGVLMNTAIAGAQDPVMMAGAMAKAVAAGREAFLAGRIPRRKYGSPSSPVENMLQ